jgi:hypothetical protein
MIFSDQSIARLKLMSRVSRTAMFNPGKIQRCAAVGDKVMIEVQLDEEIPVSYGISDMQKLVNYLNLMKPADVTFHEKFMTIRDPNGWQATTGRAGAELINIVESMEAIDTAPIVLAFDVTAETLTRMLKFASQNQLTHLGIIDTPNGIQMKAYKTSVSESDNIVIPLTTEPKAEAACVKTPFVVAMNNFLVEPANYRVMIAEMGFARFETEFCRYVVATEVVD